MKGNFFKVKKFLETRFPELEGHVHGTNYPPTQMAQTIASITGMIWFVGIALMIGGSFIFKTLKIPEPEFYKFMQQNQVMCFVSLFMINNIGSSMLTTGAFEVFMNGDLAFSKLASGKFPDAQDLVNSLAEKGFM